MGVPLSAYLILSAYLFALGVIGVATRRNALIIFMSIEMMLNAVNLSFITFSYKLKQVDGHIFSFFVMVVAAAGKGSGGINRSPSVPERSRRGWRSGSARW